LRDFAGALAGEKARKGVFITTSHFTEHAKSFVRKIESKIVLIDGNELANFMIDHGVGVSLASTYEIKKIDTDYFEEDAH
jgi:restriction system protein